jgi:hypothetical protein
MLNDNDIKISLCSVKSNGVERAKISILPMPVTDIFMVDFANVKMA